MPAMFVHYTFAYDNANGPQKKYIEATRLGSQGPDPFFFYGILRTGKGSHKKHIRKFGSLEHRKDISEDYLKMRKYAESSEDSELLLAYLDGLWMHYCVDRTFHPYVFYRSGFNENGQLKGYYSYSHARFESILDVEISKERGIYQRISNCIKIDKEQLLKISKLWTVVDEEIKEKDFYYAVKDYAKVENFLFSRTGLKRLFFLLGGPHNMLMGISYPHFYKHLRKYDVQNVNKTEWKNPVSGVVSYESVDELFERASKDFKKVSKILYLNIDDETKLKELKDFVNLIDHSGTPVGSKKIYMDVVFKK